MPDYRTIFQAHLEARPALRALFECRRSLGCLAFSNDGETVL